jgi:hypothetical protein
MSREVPKHYKQRLGDMGGYLTDGVTPKMRLVFAPEAKRPHGKWAGTPKYVDPETNTVMPFWILEQWYPPTMLGSRDTWDYDFLGIYPADCRQDCCNGGFWGLRMPITTDGTVMELTDQVLDFIERRQFADVQWSLLSEIERQRALDANLSEREQKSDAESLEEYIALSDHYFAHKQGEDNADNRIFVFPEHIQPQAKGIREAIGRPNIKI